MNENASLRILLVDDEIDLLEICTDAFEMDGFKVYAASSGEEALGLLRNHEVDAVISDFMMPGMSGEQFLGKSKELFSTKGSFPLFYFSTGAVDVDENSLISKGATGIISKPFDIDEMIEKIKDAIISK